MLEVVRQSYDTLTLRLYDNLDVIQPYNERSMQSGFIAHMVRRAVQALHHEGALAR